MRFPFKKPLAAKVAAALRRASLESVSRMESRWWFGFDVGGLGVDCPWRVTTDGRVVLASDDDGHQFGLPNPIDAEAEATALLLGRVTGVEVRPGASDLAIDFGDQRLEILSNSRGYEAWQLNLPKSIIVASGGRLSEQRQIVPGVWLGGRWE